MLDLLWNIADSFEYGSISISFFSINIKEKLIEIS